jgi:hypothetical protein
MSQISFSVPMIPQDGNPICWVACVAMITSFKTNTTHSISEFTGGFEPGSSCIPNPASSWDDMEAKLAGFGFTPDAANMSISADYIVTTLQSHGPFIIFVFLPDADAICAPVCINQQSTTDSHALIVNGVDTNVGTVQITNPWGTNVPLATIDVVVNLMQEVSDAGHNPAAFMP